MRTAIVAAVAILAGGTYVKAAYTYYYSDTLTTINSSYWAQNGSLTAGSSGLTSSSSGSLISTVTVPTWNGSIPMYEVRAVIDAPISYGNFILYLRASSNALLNYSAGTSTGTYYAAVISPYNNSGVCYAYVTLVKSVAGSLTTLANSEANCKNGTLDVTFNETVGDQLNVYVNGWDTVASWDADITTGQPGIGVSYPSGVPLGNTISLVDLGPWDSIAPTWNQQLIKVSAFPNRVDFQWVGAVDDPNGTGIAFYEVYRGSNEILTLQNNMFAMSDTAVSPSTTYTYYLQAYDYFWNYITLTLTVTTPPANSVDPREVGVRPLGSYWGTGTEEIDMLSGNLNYSLPLIKAMGRGGWSVGINLSYNSQNWREDSAGTWQIGRDVGYGYGWRLQSGSLTPVYTTNWAIEYYLFIDATGAEYHLTGGPPVWQTYEGLKVYYDSSAGLLHFPDGSFWAFGSTSAGTEQDAGTMYPTLMEDSNGNQLS